MRFLKFLSTCFCIIIYLKLKASFSLYRECSVLKTVILCVFVEDSPSFRVAFVGRFSMGRRFIMTSLSGQPWRSSLISDVKGGCIKFFRSKQVCFALSQLKFFVELIFAMFDNGVLGVRHI